MASKKKGFKIGHIRIKEKGKGLTVENPSQIVPQEVYDLNTGRAKNEITMAGVLE